MTTAIMRTETVSGWDSVSTMTDEDVAAWLNEHHPAMARDFEREARRIEDQQCRECPYACSKAGGCLLDDILVGIPAADLISAYGKHWAFQLFPGCGAAEICGIAAPLLTKSEALALSLTFGLGLSAVEAAAQTGVHQATLYRRLQSARKKLVAAFRDDRLPAPEEQRDSFDFWNAAQASHPTIYRRPSRKAARAAYVCDCGRHLRLNNHFLDHRRVDSNISKTKMRGVVRERHLNCPCGRNWPESEWPHIVSGFGSQPLKIGALPTTNEHPGL